MRHAPALAFALTLCSAASAAGCGAGGEPKTAGRTPLAEKWLARAKQSFHAGDFDDAHDASRSALQAAPSDVDARVLGAQVAMARLDFPEALKLTAGLDTPEAHRIRGRAHWYAGEVEQAADELEALLKDPSVKDPWAQAIEKLARLGTGRKPFTIEGGLVAAVEMPRVGPALVVPCELEGERILALVATAVGEVTVDSNSRKDPAWVNLRFGDRIEVKDVPALVQDLAPIGRQLGAPIKAMLGVNLLRRLHVTFDRRGDQFVVRKEDAPTPPDASRLPVWYVKGGGMVVRASVTGKEDAKSPFLVDSAAAFPVALEDASWRKAGIDPASLKADAATPLVKTGVIPTLRFGSYDLPRVPGIAGVHTDEARASLDVDLAGVVGSGLLAVFRVTLADEGRTMWLEPDPGMAEPPPGSGGPGGADALPTTPRAPVTAPGKATPGAPPKGNAPSPSPVKAPKGDGKPAPAPSAKAAGPKGGAQP